MKVIFGGCGNLVRKNYLPRRRVKKNAVSAADEKRRGNPLGVFVNRRHFKIRFRENNDRRRQKLPPRKPRTPTPQRQSTFPPKSAREIKALSLPAHNSERRERLASDYSFQPFSTSCAIFNSRGISIFCGHFFTHLPQLLHFVTSPPARVVNM